jgi:polysaccharide biosynthesis protein PslH
LPYPPYSGGRRREFELIKGLSSKVNIFLCVVTNTFEEDVSNKKYLASYCSKIKIFGSTEIGQVSSAVKESLPAQVIRNISQVASGFVKSLIASKDIDVIHLEGFYMGQHIPRDNMCPVILSTQNVEYQLWQQRYKYEEDKLTKQYYKLQSQLTRKYEIQEWSRSDLCLAITDDDLGVISRVIGSGKCGLLPNGFDHLENEKPSGQEVVIKSPSLLYVGNFAYQPNKDGVRYFCTEIWPLIKQEIPDINVYFVGNSPDEEIKNLSKQKGIYVTGVVESLKSYYAKCDVFICPLRIGGGIKMKMLEAMYFNMPIVSTSVGVQGFTLDKNDRVLVRDNTEGFSEGVIEKIRNVGMGISHVRSHKPHLATLSRWDCICSKLIGYYRYMAK